MAHNSPDLAGDIDVITHAAVSLLQPARGHWHSHFKISNHTFRNCLFYLFRKKYFDHIAFNYSNTASPFTEHQEAVEDTI